MVKKDELEDAVDILVRKINREKLRFIYRVRSNEELGSKYLLI